MDIYAWYQLCLAVRRKVISLVGSSKHCNGAGLSGGVGDQMVM